MSKLSLSLLLVFQALWLLQCAAQASAVIPDEHFFLTFLDITNTPSEFAAAEKRYIDGFLNVTRMNYIVEKIAEETDIVSNYLSTLGTLILGEISDLDKDVLHTETGYYRQLGYFYIHRYSDSDFYLGKTIVEKLDEFYKEAKTNQALYQKRDEIKEKCESAIDKVLNVWLDKFKTYTSLKYKYSDIANTWSVNQAFLDCDEMNPKTKTFLDDVNVNQKKYTSTFFRNSMYLYFDKMSFALNFSAYRSFNGQQSAPKGAQLGTLELMLYETNQAGHEIQKSLESLQRKSSSSPEAKTLFNSFVNILSGTDPDWDLEDLYSSTPGNIVYDQDWAQKRENIVHALKATVLAETNAYLSKFLSIYRYNITAFMEDISDIPSLVTFHNTYFIPIKKTYLYAFITQLKLNDGTTKEFYVESGEEKNFNDRWGNHLHNLILSWKRLKRFNAKIKCHLKNTFWGVHQNKAYKASQQPLWRIFGGVSKTLYEPCVHNDTDLVGTCTAANHEICRPIMYSEYMMRKLDEDEERAQFYFKPEPVFLPNILPNGTVECKEIETYVPPMNVCRCGFRMDCGADLGKNLTCVLEAEDNYRKRCRGSIGYPCKTLPLGPGRHHESCVTGYCNMRLNSCEYDDKKYPIVWSGVHRDDEI